MRLPKANEAAQALPMSVSVVAFWRGARGAVARLNDGESALWTVTSSASDASMRLASLSGACLRGPGRINRKLCKSMIGAVPISRNSVDTGPRRYAAR